MLASGVHLAQALETASRAASEGYRDILEQVSRELNQGQSLSACLASHPQAFPGMSSALVEIGERSGQLGFCLEIVADWLEREERIRMQIVSALSYPMLAISLCMVLTLALFRFVLPGFFEVLQGFDVPLPGLTRFFIWLTEGVQSLSCWLLALALLFGARGLYQRWGKVPPVRQRLYSLVLRIPQWGPLLHEAALLRYCLAMKVMLQAGQDLRSCLDTAAQASQSPLILSDHPRVARTLMAGQTLGDILCARPAIYPSSLRQLVQSGEEAAQLDSAFETLVGYLERSLMLRLEILSKLLEPIILGVVSLLIGSVVLAVFLPLSSYLGTLAQ
jgi:type IV pilus assembly protein PilC